MKDRDDKTYEFVGSAILLVAGVVAGCVIGMAYISSDIDTPAEAKAHYERVLAEEQKRHGEAMTGTSE